MKIKKIVTAVTAIALSSVFAFSGCSFFRDDDEGQDEQHITQEDHVFSGAWIVEGDDTPTQTSGGTARRYCTANDGGEETLALPALTDDNYVITNNTAAVGQSGTGTYTIIINGVTVSFTAPTPALPDTSHKTQEDHVFSGAWIVEGDDKPTQTSGGTARRYCTSNDGGEETLALPPLSDGRYNLIDDNATVGQGGTGTYVIEIDGITVSFTAPTPALPEVSEGGDVTITDEIITYVNGASESASIEWTDSKAASARVYYKKTGASAASYVQINDGANSPLVRQLDNTTARADIVGIAAGTYDIKVIDGSGKTHTATNIQVTAYDRSGYAHFQYTDGVGAYKDDGTPKANANIVYVTEDNKNSTFTVENRNFTGIGGLLAGAKNLSNPLIVRIIGTVGAATWNQIEYNPNGEYSANNKISADKIVGADGTTQLPTAATTTQATLLASGYNTLNYNPNDEFYTSRTPVDGKTCAELLGLTSQITYDGSAYDSCWNDLRIPDAKNITVEGIGEDARIFQWGMTFQKCNSIEVRNITFDDYTEDACSFESSSDSYTSKTDPNGFTYKHFWVHNNTFEEGMNYWDVSDEQDKHDGDGSTDLKRIAYVTFSYNVYNETHKTGLVGSSNSVYTASVTFHHNFYNNCKARLPLARKANMHMYNNYYCGTSSTDLSLRANAYAFVENCYFENNNRPVELQYDVNNGSGAAKLVGCVIDSSRTYIYEGVPTTNLGINVDREATVTNNNEYGTTFDTNSSLFYCKTVDGKIVSDVENMLTAAETKALVPQLAGVMKRVNQIGETSGDVGGEDDGDIGDIGGGETQTRTISIISDFTPAANIETYTMSFGSDVSACFDNSGLVITKPSASIGVTSGALKLESATKVRFTTSSDLPEGAKLKITISSTDGINVTAGSSTTKYADVGGVVTIDLAKGTAYELGRVSGATTTVISIEIILPV